MSDDLAKSMKYIASTLQRLVERRQPNDTSTRIDFSPFRGVSRNASEVLSFLTRLNGCFNIKGWGLDHNVEKIHYFVKHLDGPAMTWWTAVKPAFEENPQLTFKDVLEELKKYFIDPNYMAAVKKTFFSMQQRSPSIPSYVNQLDTDYAADEIKMDVFISAPRDDVAGHVRSLRPTTLEDAILSALSLDNGVPVTRRSHNNRGYNASNLGGGHTPMDIDHVEAKKKMADTSVINVVKEVMLSSGVHQEPMVVMKGMIETIYIVYLGDLLV